LVWKQPSRCWTKIKSLASLCDQSWFVHGIDDMVIPGHAEGTVATPKRLSSNVQQQYLDGAITTANVQQGDEIWSGITEKVADEMFGASSRGTKIGVINPITSWRIPALEVRSNRFVSFPVCAD